MRINRLIWLFTFILALVGISFYGGPVSYGFLTLVILLPIISLAYLLCVFQCFRIYQSVDAADLTAGVPVPFTFRLMNEFFFPYAGVRVTYYTSFSELSGLSDAPEYELLPDTGIERESTLLCRYRGEYEVGVKTVEIRDFLKLFRFSYKNPGPFKVVVKPRVTHLSSLAAAENTETAKDSPFAQDIPDLLVREYVPGDDVRFMSWKASARTGKLMMRKMTGEEKQGVGILMSTRRYGELEAQFLPPEDRILEAAISLSLYFAEQNVPTELWYGTRTPASLPLPRISDFEHFYDKISFVQFEYADSEGPLFAPSAAARYVQQYRMFFLILDKLSQEAKILLQFLSDSQLPVTVLLVSPQEEDIASIRLPHVTFVEIPRDADIREVLA